MKSKTTLFKSYSLLLAIALNSLYVSAGSPQLIWHQTYGESSYQQQVVVTAIDNYDNYFVAGFVNFGTNGNILVNLYDGIGNLEWNRMYSNNYASGAIDKPVALFPNNNAGVTVVGYINKQAILTHIFSYDQAGNISADNVIGDTTTGQKTYPFAVIYDGASSYYILGLLNNVSKVFKCDNSGNVIWSAALYNNFNNQVGSINFEPYTNGVIAAVTDSATGQVVIHRYDQTTGAESAVINTHITSLPVNGNYIKTQVDQNSNILLAATGIDTGGRTQLVVDKFDTLGNSIWSTMCNSTKGHSNTVNSFLLDHAGDILISGPYSDDTDSWQYGAVYKIPNATGGIQWSAIDSFFLVNAATVQVDLFNYVYLGTTKTPSAISPYYSDFSFTQLTPDSGFVQWNRSFDNSANNTGLMTQVNNFGDIFLATTTTTDSSSEWFLGRVGNDAGDVVGTGIQQISGKDNSMTVFPNPFASTTNIAFTSLQSEKLTLGVYDIAGRLLQQQPVESVPGYNQVAFKGSLTAGIYLFKLEGTGNALIKRVVVY